MYQSPRRLCSALLLRDAPGLRRTLVPGPRRTLAPPVLGSRPKSPQLQAAAASGAARSRPRTGERERGMNGRRGLVPCVHPGVASGGRERRSGGLAFRVRV
ncbi:CCR4 carbon catabolite repression 4-like (S. cerevisiae), isoform CRA_b [Mus musculus]|nr:CCR4 carbon catabolite repression 4-like (S. cerevisiae), isoform CRA_b [Mus musculus]